jgi:DNA-binding PadR family transcriptional regulator
VMELAGVERDFFAEAFDLLLADLDEVGLSTALRSLILFLCLDGEDQARNVKELEYFLRVDRNVIRPALKVAMKEGLIIHLDKGAPRGTARRYQLTEKGRDLLGRHCAKEGPVLL